MMDPVLLALLEGLGVAAGVVLALYFAWLRPALEQARRQREEAESFKARLDQESDARRKELMVEAKEAAIRFREQAEEEIKQKQSALQRLDEKLSARDEAVEQRRVQVEQREAELARHQREAAALEEELRRARADAEAELQRVSRLSRDAAREEYLAHIAAEFREVGAQRAREIEAKAVAEADQRAKKIVLDTMHRCAVEYVTESTIAVVELPSEDMKGRIIGREGRNIRAFEQVTGVDLIIDETPEAVVISSFDPVRRETARLALMNLMLDGRIHPGRIEELYEKAQQEVARIVVQSGERAAERAEVPGLGHRTIEILGQLRFRTSYAQNVLDHSVEVAHLASGIAAELGLNVDVARRAGLLHDIGKALGTDWQGPHALAGMEFLRTVGEKEAVLHAVGAHHHEIEPQTSEAFVVIVADAISAARPGARRESLENYIKRLAALEQLANSFEGVERSYAVQAGREIRLIVKPDQIDDLAAARLAATVAQRIENELEYPGQIKVTVIRETRAQGMAH